MLFYAINRQGEQWTANPAYKNQYLVMLENGDLAVVTDFYDSSSVRLLDKNEWKRVMHGEQDIPEKKEKPYRKIQCPRCEGRLKVLEIVDHDEDYNSVYEERECDRCHASGYIIKYT